MEELTPALLSLAEVQRVLQGLLVEQVPINDLPRIYEALTLRAKVSTEPEGLVEAARGGARPGAGRTAPGRAGTPGDHDRSEPWSSRCWSGCDHPNWAPRSCWSRERIDSILGSVKAAVAKVEAGGLSAVLVCAPALRPAIRRLVSPQAGGIPVMSYQEVTAADVTIETVGVVRVAQTIAA